MRIFDSNIWPKTDLVFEYNGLLVENVVLVTHYKICKNTNLDMWFLDLLFCLQFIEIMKTELQKTTQLIFPLQFCVVEAFSLGDCSSKDVSWIKSFDLLQEIFSITMG